MARAVKYPTLVTFVELEVLSKTINEYSSRKETIWELFLNHMKILSVSIAKKSRPDMDCTVDRWYENMFERVRAHFLPSSSSRESWRSSAEVFDSLRDNFIDLVDGKLNPNPIVQRFRRIRRKNVWAPEDGRYKEGPVPKKKRTKRAPRKAL